MMVICIGFVLLTSLIVGGTYIYLRLEELDRMIEEQRRHTPVEVEDGKR